VRNDEAARQGRPDTYTITAAKPSASGGVSAKPREEARRLIDVADGFENGLRFVLEEPSDELLVLPRLARVVARELLRTLDMLEAERAARVAMREARDRLLEIVVGERKAEGVHAGELVPLLDWSDDDERFVDEPGPTDEAIPW
jgi:hypothetical protein